MMHEKHKLRRRKETVKWKQREGKGIKEKGEEIHGVNYFYF